ncbi:MAG: tetratricopeptide repeat protein [Acidobacteria bacterium]|nr:tetratricopeptide repeat protein [Acidobacteriota bacterium]
MVGSIGPYRIIRSLGAGGMGEVYLGHDGRLDRHVALKSVSDALAATPDARRRLLGEARAVARLNHPNIAAVHDVLDAGDRTFIVMEYVEGETLAARLERGRPPLQEIVAIARQLAAGLAHAHEQGVIHRDLKPSNVVLTSQDSVKILDFGLATMAAREALGPLDETKSVWDGRTAAGAILGTPAYMSPEQLLGRELDPRSDLYSFGVILYQMTAGRLPFEADDIVSLAVAVASAPAPDPSVVDASIPPMLGRAIMRALAKEPSERFQSATEMGAAIANALSPTAAVLPGGDTAPPAPTSARDRRLRAVAPVVVLLLAAVGVWSLSQKAQQRLSGGPSRRPSVVALLPVTNLAGDPKTESIGVGVASILTENLSTTAGLTVLSRSATLPYGEKRTGLKDIAAALGADFLIDVRLERTAATLRAEARLLQAGVEPEVWRNKYEGTLFAVDRALLSGIVAALQQVGAIGTLTDAQASRLRKLPTSSDRAFDYYADARALLDRSHVLGNTARAVELLEQAVRADPRFATAFAALGDAYWLLYQETKDRALADKASAAASTALDLDPGQAGVHNSMATRYYATGQPRDAVLELGRALDLQPDNDETHRLLGRILAELGQLDEGLAELRRAIELRPNFWSHHFSLGYVLYNAGRYREALEAYRRVTELQPTFAGGFQMLGTTYHRLGDTGRAIGHYEHAVRLGPNAAAYSNLGYFYYMAGRFSDALDAYKEALTRNPTATTHMNIGDVYRRLGRATDAAAAYRQAATTADTVLTVNPRDARTIALLALCEARLGRTTDAERHIAEAAVLSPSDKEVLLKETKVHVLAGQVSEAMISLRRALASGYDAAEARVDEDLAPLRRLPDFDLIVGPGGHQLK